MKKKILALLLSFSILSLAAGCSNAKTEPEKETPGMEDVPETDVSAPEDIQEPEPEAPVMEPEISDEKEEAPVEQEAPKVENTSRIPLEKGIADENTTAVVYYEFKN